MQPRETFWGVHCLEVEHLCEVGIDCAVAVGFGRLELFAGTDLSYDVDVALVRFYLAYLVGMAGGLGWGFLLISQRVLLISQRFLLIYKVREDLQ